MNNQNCRTCAFAELSYRCCHKDGTEEEYLGICNRYPPILIPHEAKNERLGSFFENDFCWQQPVVNMLEDNCTDWCGEYINKDTGEKWSLPKGKA